MQHNLIQHRTKYVPVSFFCRSGFHCLRDGTAKASGGSRVFGKDIKNREVYIKIMISNVGGQTICISFHLAESKMTYPFKEIL